MAKAPDGTVLGEISSDDEGNCNPTGNPEIEAGEHGVPNPHPMGGAGAVGGAGARPHRNRTPECPHRPRTPENPNPIHELIAALREATLGPFTLDAMDWIHPQIIGPESKFNPQFLKEYQVKDLMHIC